MPKLYKTANYALLWFLAMFFSIAGYAQPIAGFTASAYSGCSPLKVNFTNTSSSGTAPYKWLWKFDNGNTSNLKDPGAIFITAKTYRVTLVVTDASGKTDSVTKLITVYQNPVADFSVDKTQGCPPVNVTFTDKSNANSGSLNTWLWDFGDGSTSTSKNPPKHQYGSPGIYTVSLYIVDNNGCSNSIIKSKLISVFQPPVVDFSSTPNGGCEPPVAISFTPKVTSTGGLKYLWDFGDGDTSSSMSPVHNYVAKGLFTVSLTCIDGNGCSDEKTKPKLLYIGKPYPLFKFAPPTGCAPLTIHFTNASLFESSSGDKYFWDFGDGATSTAVNPIHTFLQAKYYSIIFVVTSPFGCTDTLTKANLIKPSGPFKASFTGDSFLCHKPYNGAFYNTSGFGSNVVSWDFGDGSKPVPGVGDKIYHEFPDSGGPYTIKMTVSKNGCVETIEKINWVQTKVTEIDINALNYRGCAPLKTYFGNGTYTEDSIISTLWDFGDGTTSKNWVGGYHIYNDTGIYKATLVIKTAHCTFFDTLLVYAGSKPKADFTVYPDSGCLSVLRNLHFINLTNPGNGIEADEFSWTFDYWPNPLRTGDENPVISKYDVPPGDYTVRLISSNKGCSDTMLKIGLIKARPPWAYYGTSPDSCDRHRVLFVDSSIGATSIVFYFGDGDTSSQRRVIHTYNNPGTYRSYQIVYDTINGCSDTIFKADIVIKEPWAVTILPENATTGCLPYLSKFKLWNNDDSHNFVDFGDGFSMSSTSPDSDGQRFYHVYKKKGVYKVQLRSVSKTGCIKLITYYPVTINGPHAKFSVSPFSGCLPATVTLNDSSDNDKTITSKYYDMGNGDLVKVTSKVMTYTYKSPPPDQAKGFKITEFVKDQTCSDTFSQVVFMHRPVAGFYAFPTASCNMVNYDFACTNIGMGPFKFSWDLGDGTYTNDVEPNHTYGVGTFTVKLKMTDKYGCTDTTSKIVDVPTTKIKADFKIDVSKGSCPPFTAHFTDLSKFAFPNQHYWDWDFGDGSPHAHIQNPAKVFYVAGVFTVTLRIEDALGCTDSIIKKDVINIKGPKGNYSFDKALGCAPLSVHFSASSSNASKFEWDLGDGIIGRGDTLTHVYKDPKKYIPLLILSDSFGCSYTLPPKDTIEVYPQPVPQFKYDSSCAGLPILFFDKSNPVSGNLTYWFWSFGDYQTSYKQNPVHSYIKNGYYPVELTVKNSLGCINSIKKNVRYGNIIAAFKIPDHGCLGYPVSFTDKTRSDSAIKSWLWDFGDGSSSTLQNPSHAYMKTGIYPVSLVVSNYKGCVDTLNAGANILIGDTIAPPSPILYRVTVVDDNTVRVDFSRYNNIDFSKYVIYMKNSAGVFVPVDSVKDINETTWFATKLNTLDNVYCFKVQAVNVCGYRSAIDVPYHCTIDLSVKPGINKAILSWTPYIGWDVEKYNIYRQSVLDPPGFSIIDSVDGSANKYTDTLVICYKPMIYRVQALEKGGYLQNSWSDTAATMPIHVPNVPSTELIRATVEDNKNTLVQWNSQPASQVKHWIIEKSTDGVNFRFLDTLPHDRLYKRDSKVDVQNTSYTYRVKIQDSCEDFGPYSNIGKTILLKIDTTADVKPHLTWTNYKEWPNGVYFYDIFLKDSNGKFEWLARTQSGNDTDFVDNITDLNSLPEYVYHVVAYEKIKTGYNIDPKINSLSNDAKLKPKSRLWIPNAFTPGNYDGTNDSFFVKGLYVREFHMKIFDRWGTKVFETGNIKDKWGGDFRKGTPIMDAYKYLIYYRGVDGEVRYLNGWVTIVE